MLQMPPTDNFVGFHMQSKVEKIVPSEEDPNVAAKVIIADGPTLDADFVIMGVGVAPATGFLKDSGFPLERDGGIRVDKFLKVPGYSNIYAIGVSSLQRVDHSSAFPR